MSRHGIGEDGSSDRPRTRRVPAPGRVLALASLGAFAALLDATIVNVAFPSIQRSFPGASASQLSWVLSAYNLTFAAFVVAGGRIADLLGRRRTFSLALGGFTVASALCAAAPSVPVLIATRVLQALFSALLLPSSRGLVLASYPVERRAHAVATWTAVSAAAAGIGPPLGALLVSASGWRLVFLVNIPVGIAGIVMVSRQLVESRAPGRRRAPDLGSSFAFAAATGLLVLGIIQSQDWGWGSARVVAAFALAVALMAAFVWRCRHAADPLIDLDLFRNRGFSTASGMMLVSSVGFYGVLLSSVLFLTEVWHYPILEAGLALDAGTAAGDRRLERCHAHPGSARTAAGPRAGCARVGRFRHLAERADRSRPGFPHRLAPGHAALRPGCRADGSEHGSRLRGLDARR